MVLKIYYIKEFVECSKIMLLITIIDEFFYFNFMLTIDNYVNIQIIILKK